MFVPFSQLPAAARIWIFQADRPFTEGESSVMEARLREFTEEWTVHGSPLATSFELRFDRFIILGADESSLSASGCSIDSSVRVLKEIEQSLGIQLFDRNLIAFKTAGGISVVPLQELKEKFNTGVLNEDSLTFNNLLSSKGELEGRWIVPVRETWLKRYIPNQLANVKSVS